MALNERLLSGEELAMIATDFRQNGTPAFQRHGWELLGHIGALESRCCEQCALWVPYNNTEASYGECCQMRAKGKLSKVKLWDVSDGNDTMAMKTAFDFGCMEFTPKPVRTSEPQAFGG